MKTWKNKFKLFSAVQVVDRWFFKTEPLWKLFLFRAIFCIHTALLVGYMKLDYIFKTGSFYPIKIFEDFGISLLSLGQLKGLQVLIVSSLLLSAVGLFPRLLMAFSALGIFLLYGTFLSLTESPLADHVDQSQAILIYLAFWLSFTSRVSIKEFFNRGAPIKSILVKQIEGWPLKFCAMTLASAYFCSGYSKISTSGLKWMDGNTLLSVLMTTSLYVKRPAVEWLIAHHEIVHALSILTIFWELTFFVGIMIPFLRWVYIFGGILFHLSIYYLISVGFILFFITPYSAFAPDLIENTYKLFQRFRRCIHKLRRN